jgi:Ca-activated chloride channel homolog
MKMKRNRPIYRNGSYLLRTITGLVFLLALTGSVAAQGEKKFVRQGNRDYGKDKFSQSEILYRKAADKNKTYPDAVFNIGDALYKQKKFEDAGREFTGNSSMNEKRPKKADAFYNLGNSMFMANKLKESIEAYKSSLKLDPGNMEAKYNLAYAQDMLVKQQEQQKQQQNQGNNKDQNKKDQNKDQQNKNNQQQNKDQKNQDQQQHNQQQQQQQQAISKEDAERLLNAIANDEKNVQEKVKLAEAARAKVRTTGKNW